MTAKAPHLVLPAMLLACALPVSLGAQPAPPAGAPAPQLASPAPAQPAPAPPAPAAPAAPAAGAALGAGAGPQPPQPSAPVPAWLPQHAAELQIVEKVDATHRTLDVPVGGRANIDTLVIEVKACLVRPPGQQRDAAAYLDITGKNAAAPAFQGWMLAAEPAVSLFEDPLYDVRVMGCR